MANIGIISEFNPFHTGHKHLIDSVKGENDTVICVMSGNFVQRGDVAIYEKSERVRAALKNGADLIIELPLPYTLSTAQRFAEGSTEILNSLGVIDKLCFGSECGDIKTLENIADILSTDEFQNKISEQLKSGKTYAKIRTDILGEYNKDYAEILTNPNNILGVEYILASRKLGADFIFQTVKRIGASHDAGTPEITASASYIREKIISGEAETVKDFLPSDYSDNFANLHNLENAILSSLRTNNKKERYLSLPDISEGIENRIIDAVKNSSSLSELYKSIKTKRYTLSRIRRIIMCAFLGVTEELAKLSPPYIRVLGFTEKGKNALSVISQKASLPIICTAKDAAMLDTNALKVFELECTAADIWALSLNYPQKCGNEYYHKIVKE